MLYRGKHIFSEITFYNLSMEFLNDNIKSICHSLQITPALMDTFIYTV